MTSPRQLSIIAVDLAVRHTTVELVATLRDCGVEPIVLKGPLLGDWLGTLERVSEDVDLLVGPDAHDDAQRCLAAAGYRRLLPDHPGPIHASTWCRGREAITVDLHGSLPGATSVPERQWIALASHTVRVAFDGGEVAALDLDARLVLLALHAAHHGIGVSGPLSDLRVGLAKTTDTDWSRAALLAGALGAEAALVSGLRLLDEGQALVHRLALDAPSNANLALRAATPPHTAHGFERLDEVHGRHDRARVIISELVPPPTYMRDWTPVARRGRPGLALAYVYRLSWLARWAPRGYLAWRRAKRESERSRRE